MAMHFTDDPGPPLVSIGLPVYNGANYLADAVEGLLAQTHCNLEVIICDNASTDATPQVCEELAGRDPRIRLYRNEKNLGAAANYNRVFHLARGTYFKWAAHDDVLAPEFVARAVAVLEREPEVVLCTSRTRRIDETGAVTGEYPSDPAWDAPSPAARFRSLVFTRHACVAVFGLIRREELARTSLIAPYVSSDRVLLAELGLRGRIHEVPEDLLFRRDHKGSSLRAYPDPRTRVIWFDPARSAGLSFPEWNEALGYARAALRSPLSVGARSLCTLTATAWLAARWRPLLADFKYAALSLLPKRAA